MKLSDFDDAKLKRIAIELQSALLEHPCGEKLNIEFDYLLASDAFRGATNIKLSVDQKDRKVFMLRVHNDYDSQLEEPYGREGLKVIVFSTAFCYLPITVGNVGRMRSFSPENMDELVDAIINLMFFVIPESEEPIKSIKTAIATKHNKCFVDLHDSSNPRYFFWDKGLKLDELEVGQTLMVEIATERETYSEFLRIKRIEINGKEETSSLKNACSKHGAHSLLKLIEQTHIKIIVSDLAGEREFSSMMRLKKHGVAAALFYNDERCHADVLRKA